jgi:glycosyltransferase involved in cell wall biosynthesis
MPVRLAIVTHNVLRGDGQGRANYEIARHALRQGHKVSLLADAVDDDLVSAGANWIKIQPRSLRRVNLFKVWAFARTANRLLTKMQDDFDLVHGYGYCLDIAHQVNTSQYVHSAWRKSPYHTARQHRNLYGLYQWTYSALNAAWERRAYERAQVVVAASSTVRQELRDLGIPDSRLRVIWNGADTAEFHPGAVDRAALGLPGGVPLALFGGDLKTPRKNLDTVLTALSRTAGVHLAVAGRTEGSPFPAMAERLGIADRVHFLGFRRDVADVMRAVDLFVFPSRYEAFALVIAEATASGLPIITAKTTGGAEIVTERSGILLDDPNDADALTAAITTLAGDPDRRKAMSGAAWERAQDNTWESVARQYLQLYREFGK